MRCHWIIKKKMNNKMTLRCSFSLFSGAAGPHLFQQPYFCDKHSRPLQVIISGLSSPVASHYQTVLTCRACRHRLTPGLVLWPDTLTPLCCSAQDTCQIIAPEELQCLLNNPSTSLTKIRRCLGGAHFLASCLTFYRLCQGLSTCLDANLTNFYFGGPVTAYRKVNAGNRMFKYDGMEKCVFGLGQIFWSW